MPRTECLLLGLDMLYRNMLLLHPEQMLVVKNTRLINTGNIINPYAMLLTTYLCILILGLRIKHLFSTTFPSSLLAIQDH
jgi:hypothetical protein